ncbi:hypothetical protein [Streptomyces sp. NPDC008122]|uniref:hypothetical protein n=1 Tax=Streptomyces sp. NPDC008122 TaxID=3364810 RepID=UPI0036F0F2B9
MNPTTRRRLAAAPLAAALLALLALLAAAAPAAAHPLGNFTVNYATSLTLRPGAIEAEIVVDRAEIAAAQERPLIDQLRHYPRNRSPPRSTSAQPKCGPPPGKAPRPGSCHPACPARGPSPRC